MARHDSPQVDSGRDSERGDTPMTGRDDRDDGDDEPEPEVEGDDMDAMQAMMGFGGFGTTKGQKIAGNNVGAVRKEKKTEYRQYMNRQGGFNRPLSPNEFLKTEAVTKSFIAEGVQLYFAFAQYASARIEHWRQGAIQ
ncbi:hypothetical protein K4K51_011155 [Colletotrichum sp. SAR 10_75]|nr:hypothetical protein K4K51_011155 [Colletotrichum sp. SAR 10_75]